MDENRDILTLEEAVRRAWDAADEIVARFENYDPSARYRLFSQSLLIFLKHFNILPPRPPQSGPRTTAFMRSWGVS